MRVVALSLILLVCSVSAALAAKPLQANSTFAFVETHRSGSTLVEQQPGAVNPTNCLWSIDDKAEAGAYGTLTAGQSSEYTVCLIADHNYHLLGVDGQVVAGVRVEVSYQPQGLVREVPLPSCLIGPVYSTISELPQISDSNGGHGVVTQVTVRVTNTTGKTVRKQWVHLVLGSSEVTRQTRYCAGGNAGELFPFAGAAWQDGEP